MGEKTAVHSKAIAGPSFVIAVYRPKPGAGAGLRELVMKHVPRLRELGLATSSPSHVMEALDGSILEVFEWVSAEAVARAHEDPHVQELWKQFSDLCDYPSPAQLAECQQVFPHFKVLASV